LLHAKDILDHYLLLMMPYYAPE